MKMERLSRGEIHAEMVNIACEVGDRWTKRMLIICLIQCELQQHKPRICENNWIRRIAGVKGVGRRRMKDLR